MIGSILRSLRARRAGSGLRMDADGWYIGGVPPQLDPIERCALGSVCSCSRDHVVTSEHLNIPETAYCCGNPEPHTHLAELPEDGPEDLSHRAPALVELPEDGSEPPTLIDWTEPPSPHSDRNRIGRPCQDWAKGKQHGQHYWETREFAAICPGWRGEP